jgi:hypothetical protein
VIPSTTLNDPAMTSQIAANVVHPRRPLVRESIDDMCIPPFHLRVCWQKVRNKLPVSLFGTLCRKAVNRAGWEAGHGSPRTPTGRQRDAIVEARPGRGTSAVARLARAFDGDADLFDTALEFAPV